MSSEIEKRLADLEKRMEALEATASKVCPVCENGEKKPRVRHYESCTIPCKGCDGHGFVRLNGDAMPGYCYD